MAFWGNPATLAPRPPVRKKKKELLQPELPFDGDRPPSIVDSSNAAPTFTERQGQVLAFIHLYMKLHRRPPGESDITEHFGLTPPSVHSMIVRLHEKALIAREPGQSRSIRVLVPAASLPELA